MKLTFQIPAELESDYGFLTAFQWLPVDWWKEKDGSYTIIINNSPVSIPQWFVDWTDEEKALTWAIVSENRIDTPGDWLQQQHIQYLKENIVVSEMRKRHDFMYGKFTDDETYWLWHRDQLGMLLQLHWTQ